MGLRFSKVLTVENVFIALLQPVFGFLMGQSSPSNLLYKIGSSVI